MKPLSEIVMSAVVRPLVGDARWADMRLRLGYTDKSLYYDEITELLMRRVLSPSSVCVDVGSHRGSLLRAMMRFAPEGRFLAAEPLPDLFQVLKRDFPSQNVVLCNLALGSSTGTSEFNWVTSNPAYSGLQKRKYDRPNETDQKIIVNTDTLDNVLDANGLTNISFIKIDVEGGEFDVIKGGMRAITRDKPYIVFEHGRGASEFYGHGPDEMFGLLTTCGLRVSLIQDFLKRKPPLSLAGFCDQFCTCTNYYFLAHP